MSPAKALRRALSRTADVNWDLALVTLAVTIDQRDQDGVIDGLGKSDLLILIDGPEGALGLAVLDREVITGLIEVQTIQQVTQMPVDTDRVLTPTDAAMMAPMIDGTMERFVENLGDHPLLPQIEGYRFGAMLEDARSAGLLLNAANYRVFRAEVDIALGRRRGFVTFILPDRRKPKGKGPENESETGPGPHADVFGRVPARLDAVLAHLSMPLNKAQALKPGDLVPLPHDALDRVELSAGRGRSVVVGRLGQLNGMRAVRLSMPPAKGAAAMAKPAADQGKADFSAAAQAEEPGLPALAEGGGFDAGGFDADSPEPLPDLPAMDFAAEAGEFDMDFGGGGGDFDAAPAEGGETLPAIGTDFASAPVEFDFEE
ncbi:FliM/FliN family flagellar motor C-terminal domain-containing protein [Tropicibacter oceani]|uniref:FliM/FliN family flagellar motor C-terminal domain-containing protein n=1 Tax=Tropicibacter oceani TaxID=3058420 RepID=A0ABY8QIH0_9RHOB|nr:FliM/FliN family flagellar motor C-terminal domain-containing protein [Tropicibacter oceani]WGW03786.1 FliM/FliN family flagellar motor C-terminal domain-containing protein [Tropicibacter oceani]